jgi:hypothetical protein
MTHRSRSPIPGDRPDAAESFRPPPAPHWNVVIAPDREDLICHHDLAPWNLVRDGDRWVFIDWDSACPAAEYIEAHLQRWSASLLE